MDIKSLEDNTFEWEDDAMTEFNNQLKYSLGQDVSYRYDQIDPREHHQVEEFILQLSQKETEALEYFGEQCHASRIFSEMFGSEY
jgi:hypothetical protein